MAAEPDAAEAVEAAARALSCTVVRLISANWTSRLSVTLTEQIQPGKPVVIRPFTYKGNAQTTLLGSYQPQNAALALETVFALQRHGWDIPHNPPSSAASPPRAGPAVSRSCRVPGDLLWSSTAVHNPQNAQALADSLADVFAGRKVVLLSGVMADKDYPAMLRTVLPHAAAFIAVTPGNPQALPAAEYASEAADQRQNRPRSTQTCPAAQRKPMPKRPAKPASLPAPATSSTRSAACTASRKPNGPCSRAARRRIAPASAPCCQVSLGGWSSVRAAGSTLGVGVTHRFAPHLGLPPPAWFTRVTRMVRTCGTR